MSPKAHRPRRERSCAQRHLRPLRSFHVRRPPRLTLLVRRPRGSQRNIACCRSGLPQTGQRSVEEFRGGFRRRGTCAVSLVRWMLKYLIQAGWHVSLYCQHRAVVLKVQPCLPQGFVTCCRFGLFGRVRGYGGGLKGWMEGGSWARYGASRLPHLLPHRSADRASLAVLLCRHPSTWRSAGAMT